MFGSIVEPVVEGEWQWPETPLGRNISSMESSLRCGICSEYFGNPHSLSCGHSFCSECIRRHLDQTINPTTSGICPSCRAPALVSHLRPEKTLFELTQHFQTARNGLLAVLTSGGIDASKIVVDSSSHRRGKGSGTAITKRLTQGHFHKQGRDAIKKSIEKLTEHCTTHLRTDGDRDVLEKRHKDFVHLHNAQLDSPNPLSMEQVILEVHRRENAKTIEAKKEDKTSNMVEKMKNGEFTREANDSFAKLIKKARMGKSQAGSAVIDGAGRQASAISEKDCVEDISDWKIMKSQTLNKIFYYNVKTKIGQFGLPESLGVIGGSPDPHEGKHSTPTKSLYANECMAPTQVATASTQLPADDPRMPKPYFNDQGFSSGGRTTRTIDSTEECDQSSSPAILDAADEDKQFRLALKRSLEDDRVYEVDEKVEVGRTDNGLHASQESEHAEVCESGEPAAHGDEQWSCLQCTYINEASSAACDMCLSVRPRAKSSRHSSQRSLSTSQVSFETPWSKPKNTSRTPSSRASEDSSGNSTKRVRR